LGEKAAEITDHIRAFKIRGETAKRFRSLAAWASASLDDPKLAFLSEYLVFGWHLNLAFLLGPANESATK
jgi:hypothetical protein